MLVHFISPLFELGEIVPLQGGTHKVYPSFMDGLEAPGLPRMGGFPHLNSSSSSFNLIPLGLILEAKLL